MGGGGGGGPGNTVFFSVEGQGLHFAHDNKYEMEQTSSNGISGEPLKAELSQFYKLQEERVKAYRLFEE